MWLLNIKPTTTSLENRKASMDCLEGQRKVAENIKS